MLREVRFLSMGSCLIDRSQLVTGDPVGEVWHIPIWAYLLRGDDGVLLVDSGMPEGCIGNERFFGEMAPEELILPQMTADDRIDRVLARQGLILADLDGFITTHGHFDHAGGSARLRGCPALIHPAELAALRGDPEPPPWLDLDRDFEPAPDGMRPMDGVTVVHTPGHTPGHLSLLLEPQGRQPILLTVDAVYTRRNWELDIPGAMLDPAVGRQSVGRLREIAARSGAAVFFGHDPEQWRDAAWQQHLA